MVEENKALTALIIAILALGVGLFNTYQIKNGIVVGDGVVAEKPEKILKELPVGAPTLGSANAPLTIVEFADFQCPFCGKFHQETYPALKKEYIDTGKVRFVYLDYAFLGPESNDASEAAKCATEQGKFWQYHDQLFNNQNGENQGNFNVTNLRKFATNAGLNLTQFNSCIADTRYDQQIQDEVALGKKYGITGTPGFLIGKQLVKGAAPLDTFEQVINSQLSTNETNSKTFTLVVSGRKLVSGDKVLKVSEGDQVTINITVDEAEELHLHGYDKSVDLEKNITGTLSFTANLTGRFPFELEDSKTELGTLEVTPK